MEATHKYTEGWVKSQPQIKIPGNRLIICIIQIYMTEYAVNVFTQQTHSK